MNPPKSPFSAGLPASPRPNMSRQTLAPLNTNLRCDSATSTPSTSLSEKASAPSFVDTRTRNRDSMIFVNATIPLSPASSSSNDSHEMPYEGLAPRKRNGFARLFCCFGREERARRRAMRSMEYEKVGEKLHWTEY